MFKEKEDKAREEIRVTRKNRRGASKRKGSTK